MCQNHQYNSKTFPINQIVDSLIRFHTSSPLSVRDIALLICYLHVVSEFLHDTNKSLINYLVIVSD